MKEKDLNKMFNQDEFGRLRDILFPKKTKKQEKAAVATQLKEQQKLQQLCIKDQIQKLRKQIYNKLQKEKNVEEPQIQTQRLYLDGINKLSKNLKDYAGEINQVFQDFLQHLPTNLYMQKKNYNNHYFVSLLIQNCVWSKVDIILKKPLMEGFKYISAQNACIKEQKQLQKSMKSKRMQRQKNKNLLSTNKYFNIWRFQSKVIGLQIDCQKYRKQNCLQNDRKVLQNMLNFPFYVLLVQQINKENSDICQLLLFDGKTKRLCKFIDQNIQILNTSVQTVTQRSLLNSETSKNKIKRHEFEVKSGLTKLCIERKQFVFVNSLLTHPEYHQVDSFCSWQLSDFNKRQYLKGGLVLYPIINANQQIIGVLRQYFFEKGLKVLSTQKINKISLLLQLGAQMQRQTRKMSNQSEILKQKYYLKMISLIKKLQSEKGNLSVIIRTLSEELKVNFQIDQLAVFKAEKKQNRSKNQIVLSCLWGSNDESNFLFSIADKLLKEGKSYVYFQKRLIVLHNMMLFDLKIAQANQRNCPKRFPVELFTSTIGKIQTIITKKQEQFQQLKFLEIRQQQSNMKKLRAKFQSQFDAQSLVFISHYSEVQHPFDKVAAFLHIISNKYLEYFSAQNSQLNKISCFIQILQVDQKKRHLLMYKNEGKWQVQESGFKVREQAIKIKINELVVLFICGSFTNELKQRIQQIVFRFLRLFLQEKQRKCIKKANFSSFQTKAIDFMSNCRLFQHELQQNPKQTWQLNQLKLIYITIKHLLELFISQVFNVDYPVIWQRQQPAQSTVEEWKQRIYQFVFTQPQKIDISIRRNQQDQAIRGHRQLQFLCAEQSHLIRSPKQSFLQICVIKNQSKYNVLSYGSSIVFKLPLNDLFTFQNSESQVDNMTSPLSVIKNCWIKLCKSLIQGTTKIDEQNRRKNVLKIANCLKLIQNAVLREAVIKIRLFEVRKVLIDDKINKIVATINKNQSNWVQHCFRHLKKNNIVVKQERRFKKANPNVFQVFNRVLIRTNFRPFFQAIVNLGSQKQKTHFTLAILTKTIDKKQKEFKQIALAKFFYRSKATKKILLLVSPLHSLLKKSLNNHWQSFINSAKLETHDQLTKQSLPESFSSVKHLKSFISAQAPKYRLFLIIDSFNCIPLYSNSHSEQIVALQQVNTALQPFSVYQIGSEGQFLWHYYLKEGQNSFKVKDKLSRLSNFTEEALKNCKQLSLLTALGLKCFRSKYIKFWKSKFFKKWRQQCEVLGIQQRNRLNDCLYQLNVQGQTTKQKLKMFQKMLKGNVLMFEQMKTKKEQYLNSIKYSEGQVSKIEQSYDKLENARNMFTKLHKRTVVKSCLLLWRSNACKTTLLQKRRAKPCINVQKIAFKSILSIFKPKITKLIRKGFDQICLVKKANLKKKSVQKIKVSFEENSRLVTFQSQMNQKQNQSEHSNSFESPQGKKDTYRNLTKFKMNEMKESNRVADLSAQEMSKFNNGAYKLNPKTLKFLKRMGKLQQ